MTNESMTVRLVKQVDEVTVQRDAAIQMLADWCVRVQVSGTNWDDWDEAYKDAAHRPCAIRELLDEPQP